MAKALPKIELSEQRSIPLDKLVLSQSNVRQIKAGVAIEELAEDIARRTLLQSLTVRAVVDEAGQETGMFEVPAGGRRFRALELLCKQKRLAKNAPIPCIVRTEGLAEEDSLAENVQRAPLHPLDQFRAFQALREKGLSEEAIAAAFFISVQVVKQRLRLAAVSPVLHDAYVEEQLTLEQLMAFTVNPDPERQERVWAAIQRGPSRQPYEIRRLLTEGAVRASDKRARFVGVEAYIEAGGDVLSDLFERDDGGWLQDAGLLDRLVSETLLAAADQVAAEGFKWVETLVELPYGHLFGLRRLVGEEAPLSVEQEAAKAALLAEQARIEAEFAEAAEFSDEADQRLGEIETALEALIDRAVVFEAADVAIAGAFVSIGPDGALKIDRGYVRPADEPPLPDAASESPSSSEAEAFERTAETIAARIEGSDAAAGPVAASEPEPEEDEGLRPIPDRLVSELTAFRTVALREAVGAEPKVAFLALQHALVVRLFYPYPLDSCLDIDVKSVGFPAQPAGLAETWAARSLEVRHAQCQALLPKRSEELWDALVALDEDGRQLLFAHCVGASINAVAEPYNRRPRAIAHADRLAAAVDLDMVQAGWRTTVDGFLGRVTKARILAAVREARGERQAQLIDHLKKGEMAERAQQLLEGTGWLPEPLRTPGCALPSRVEDGAEPGIDALVAEIEPNEEPAADEGEPVVDIVVAPEPDEDVSAAAFAYAAE